MIEVTSQCILLVDDELELLDLMQAVLVREGFNNIETASSGKSAIEKFNHKKPSLVVLDIMLGDMEGYQVCQYIRQQSQIPILFVSAKAEELDRILGFAVGADDYVVKPFSPKELAYRIKAHLRRSTVGIIKNAGTLSVGPFIWNEESQIISMEGKPLELTAKEYHLLSYFIVNKNQVISKNRIGDAVWGEDYFGFDNTITVHMRKIREKIEKDPSNPTLLLTIRGLGYKLQIKE